MVPRGFLDECEATDLAMDSVSELIRRCALPPLLRTIASSKLLKPALFALGALFASFSFAFTVSAKDNMEDRLLEMMP